MRGNAKMTTLQNKTALVTGASRGIGRATAAALARAGAHVLVHYGRSAQEAESLVSEIQAKGGRANAISADLGTPNGAALLAKQVRSIVDDRLDVLVLNAGISKAARIADYTVEDFDNLFATNVRSPFFLVQQLLPVLGEGSNIIVISSLGAHAAIGKPGLDNPSVLAYASTKGALDTLVKYWAAILGPRGIRVNAIRPGAIDTDMSNFTNAADERYWSPDYIQHSNHIEPGREGLFNLIKSLPPTLKYEAGVIVAGGDFVMVHGRFSGFGAPVNWIAADIVRLQDGMLIEHWDVIQDEATQEQSKSGLPMFGDKFPR